MAKKVATNIDSGLWIEDKYGAITSVSEVGHNKYSMTFHSGRMPGHDSRSFDNLADLETAMREVAPLRDWRIKMEN